MGEIELDVLDDLLKVEGSPATGVSTGMLSQSWMTHTIRLVTAAPRSVRIPSEARVLRDAILSATAARGLVLTEHSLRVSQGLPVLWMQLGDKVLRGCHVRLPGPPESGEPDVVTVHGSGRRTTKMWPRRRDHGFNFAAIADHIAMLVDLELSRVPPRYRIPVGVPASASGLHIIKIASVQLRVLDPEADPAAVLKLVADPKVRDRIESHLVRGGLTERDMRDVSEAAGLFLGTPNTMDFDPFEPINDRFLTVLQLGKSINGTVQRRYVLILDRSHKAIDLADPAGEGRTSVTAAWLSKVWKLGATRGRSWSGNLWVTDTLTTQPNAGTF